jgi:hypothetical protein
MPCYDPPRSPKEIADIRSRADDRTWFELTPSRDIDRWLCDALRGAQPHPDCLRWWKLHKRFVDKETP